jgi:peptidoglycan hydrolase CwlO-like protein
LVEKSADATKESQKIQGSINKLNDKITSVKEKITDIENKMSKQSWGVQLVPQN